VSKQTTISWCDLSIAVVAAVILSIASSRIVFAAEDCLAAPTRVTPSGRHWYFHLDRQAHRKCWYLGPAGMKLALPAASKTVARPASGEPRALAFDAPSNAPQVRPTSDASTTDRHTVVDPSIDGMAGESRDGTASAPHPPDPGVGVTKAEPAVADTSEATSPTPKTLDAAVPAGDTEPLRRGEVVGRVLEILAGALTLATVIGLVISKFLARRRDVLHRGYAARSAADHAPFGTASRDVLRRRDSPPGGSTPPCLGNGPARQVAWEPETPTVAVEDIEESLRSLMQTLRRTGT